MKQSHICREKEQHIKGRKGGRVQNWVKTTKGTTESRVLVIQTRI